jgi:hypothetical protein
VRKLTVVVDADDERSLEVEMAEEVLFSLSLSKSIRSSRGSRSPSFSGDAIPDTSAVEGRFTLNPRDESTSTPVFLFILSCSSAIMIQSREEYTTDYKSSSENVVISSVDKTFVGKNFDSKDAASKVKPKSY